jgi:hypothetical protein
MFILKDYDPSRPALYVHADGNVEWRVSPQNAKFMYYDSQERIICGPKDFERLSPRLFSRLCSYARVNPAQADSPRHVWDWCRSNVLIKAPGTEFHGSYPAFQAPVTERSTVRTRRHGLRVNAEKLREFVGTKQAMHLAAWLADQHDGETVSDVDIELSLIRMQRMFPMKTRQSPWLVFRYYRQTLIKSGGLREA